MNIPASFDIYQIPANMAYAERQNGYPYLTPAYLQEHNWPERDTTWQKINRVVYVIFGQIEVLLADNFSAINKYGLVAINYPLPRGFYCSFQEMRPVPDWSFPPSRQELPGYYKETQKILTVPEIFLWQRCKRKQRQVRWHVLLRGLSETPLQVGIRRWR